MEQAVSSGGHSRSRQQWQEFRVRSKLIVAVLASAIGAALLSGCGKKEEAPAASAPGATAAPATEAPADAVPASDAERAVEMRRRLMDSTAQQDEWVPELVATPVDEVGDSLTRADQAMAAGRLDQGEGNALSIYLSVLETEPGNTDAIAGVDRIVAELVRRGEQALVQARFNEAARAAQVVSRLRPEDEAVVSFKAKVDSGREVALLLGEAQRLAAEGRFVSPEGGNAAAIYRDVLRSDPGNSTAIQGLASMEATMIERGLAAAQAGNYPEADRLLAEAGRVSPGSEGVQNASTRVVEIRQGRAEQLAQQTAQAIEANNLDQAATLFAQLEQVSAQAQGLEELRSRIDSARNYASLKPGQVISDSLSSGGKGPELVVIPLGSFQMGSPENEADRRPNEGPRRTVSISRAFALARNETTVGEFRAFVQATRYVPTSRQVGTSTIYDEKSGSMIDKRGVTWEDDHAGNKAAPNLPVVHVSWSDAQAYADWLGRETGERYRLPSEAEAEYVIRAGSQSRFPWGDGNPTRIVGNLTGDKDRSASRRNWVNAFPDYSDGHWGPAPVRTYEPNRFGLYDTIGNVSEWVEDCWHDNYQRAPSDGSAWVNPGCNSRVLRGASWASAPDQVRTAFRLTAGPATTNPRLGFRVARDL
jgi:formylglycine-generating enzyme required for sulfatase activity